MIRWKHPFLFSCGLLALLFFDGSGIVQCSVAAVFLHEAAHVLLYRVLVRRWPVLQVGLGGIALQWPFFTAGAGAEAAVLLAGPVLNLGVAAVCLGAALRQASYFRYFFGGINLLLGAFNLLPLGFLDGGRLLLLLLLRILPASAALRICRVLQWPCLLALGCFLLAGSGGVGARLTLLCFLIYYCGKSFSAGDGPS